MSRKLLFVVDIIKFLSSGKCIQTGLICKYRIIRGKELWKIESDQMSSVAKMNVQPEIDRPLPSLRILRDDFFRGGSVCRASVRRCALGLLVNLRGTLIICVQRISLPQRDHAKGAPSGMICWIWSGHRDFKLGNRLMHRIDLRACRTLELDAPS